LIEGEVAVSKRTFLFPASVSSTAPELEIAGLIERLRQCLSYHSNPVEICSTADILF
jgi:hypothetical protein